MWNLTNRQGECNRFRTLLEDSATAHPGARTLEELMAGMPVAIRAHFRACAACAESARELLTTRELLAGIAPAGAEPRPWFTTRVMAAIAAREREIEDAGRTWLAVPRFASKLALASGALLLIASTWLYERPPSERGNLPSAVKSPEYLFEAPAPPMNQDDVLISMAERNP
jgi:hypothetical protein